MTYAELKSAIEDGLASAPGRKSVADALAALQRLGFVWCPPGPQPPVRYEPGIPSLMAYVLDCAQPPRRRHEPDQANEDPGRPANAKPRR